MIIVCAHCGDLADKPSGQVGRSRRLGLRVFCSRVCSGLAKRKHLTEAQKKEKKRLYDIEYRSRNPEARKAKKREYHIRTYDPVKAAVIRKKNMPRHAEYCRRPEYKAWKQGYDKVYRYDRVYGPFAGVAMLLQDLKSEIDERMSNEQIRQANDCYNKRQFRLRDAKAERHDKRPRDRRDRHPSSERRSP